MIKFSDKNINTVSQHYDSNNFFINWDILKEHYKLQEENYLYALFRDHRKILPNTDYLLNYNHHFRGSRTLNVDMLTSGELYSHLISTIKFKLSSNTYFENLFKNNDIDREAIYMLPRKTAYNTYLPLFQYNIFNNILFLNKKIFSFI